MVQSKGHNDILSVQESQSAQKRHSSHSSTVSISQLPHVALNQNGVIGKRVILDQ